MSIIDTINIKGTDYDIHDRNALTVSDKGVANGVAELDANGKLPLSQFPEDVNTIYEYENKEAFPVTGESGNIYIADDTNLMWRWDGNDYITISSPLELGESSDTAYRGDRGKIAYDHSQATGNPHGTTKADLGLGNVTNNKSLAVDELQNLTPTEKETARINIGAGTVADVRVNGVSVVDVNDIALIKSYKEVTQAEYDALPSSKLTDNIMYCITDAQNGGIILNELTQAEYDLLPSSLKNANNVIYFITDGGGSGSDGVTDVLVNGVSVVDDGVAEITIADENVTREYITSPFGQNDYYNVLIGDNTSGNGHVKMVGSGASLNYYPYANKLSISGERSGVSELSASGLQVTGTNASQAYFQYNQAKVQFQSYALTMNHNDLVLTNSTWDGTNTSLKDAIAATSDTKVKQLSSTDTYVYGDYRVLLSKSDNDTEETDSVYKSKGFFYNPASGKLSLINPNQGIILNADGNATFLGDQNMITVTDRQLSGSLILKGDDIELQGSKWDGTHTSLKDAIAAINTAIANL